LPEEEEEETAKENKTVRMYFLLGTCLFLKAKVRETKKRKREGERKVRIMGR